MRISNLSNYSYSYLFSIPLAAIVRTLFVGAQKNAGIIIFNPTNQLSTLIRNCADSTLST